MQLSYCNTLLLHDLPHRKFAGSPFDDFQCTSAPPDTPSNVTELQFCDGVSDCVDDSDEPQYCPAGRCTHTLVLGMQYQT